MSHVVDLGEDLDLETEEADLTEHRFRFVPSPGDWKRLTPRTRTARLVLAAVLLTLALIGPKPFEHQAPPFAMDVGLVYALIVLGVSVLGWIGEISVAVVPQMGLGLIVMNWSQRHGWPFVVGLAAVVLASIPFSVLLGMFALRLRGINFVIASLAFGYLVQQSLMIKYFGSNPAKYGGLTRPHVVRTDAAYYYWLLGSLVLAAAVCYMIQRSRIGRAVTAMRDSETAFWTLGHSRAVYKVLVVCLSGAIATLGGAYFALLLGQVPASYYSPGLAFVFLGFALAGGLGSIGGSIAFGVLFVSIPKYMEGATPGPASKYDFLFYGISSLVIFLWVPGGIGGLGRRLWARIEGRTR